MPLEKTLILLNVTILIKSVFNTDKNNRYYNIYMLHYERIDASKGFDINKANASKERDICHYWCFLDKWLSFNHIFAVTVVMF